MEAISHAGAAVGILGKDGVVLACEKKIASKLLEPGTHYLLGACGHGLTMHLWAIERQTK
jgi:20S proteasome subunit alpha 3